MGLKNICAAALLAVGTMFAGTSAHGATVIEHLGLTYPGSEAWVNGSIGTGTGVTNSPAFQISNDSGYDAWQMTANPGGLNQTYWVSGAPSAPVIADYTANGWVMETRSRVLSNPNQLGLIDVGFHAATARFDIVLQLDPSGNTVVKVPTSSSFDGASHYVGPNVTLPGNGYHLYQLVYDPGLSSATLLIDGVTTITGYTGSTSFFTPNAGIGWGVSDDTVGNFNFVRLSTTTALPEPAALSLVVVAVGLALYRPKLRDRLHT